MDCMRSYWSYMQTMGYNVAEMMVRHKIGHDLTKRQIVTFKSFFSRHLSKIIALYSINKQSSFSFQQFYVMHLQKLKRVKSGIHITVKRYDYVYNTSATFDFNGKAWKKKKRKQTRNKCLFDKSSHICWRVYTPYAMSINAMSSVILPICVPACLLACKHF